MFRKICAVFFAAVIVPLIANAANHDDEAFYAAARVSHSWHGGNMDADIHNVPNPMYSGSIPFAVSAGGRATRSQTNDLSLAIGRDWDLMDYDNGDSLLTLRTELEYTRLHSSYDIIGLMYDMYGVPVFDSSVYPMTLDSSNLMAALFLDADYKYVGGFVGAGFGVANYGVDVRYYDIDDFWTVLNRDFMRAVYKLSAGLNFNVTARTTIELGYNFIAPVSDIDISNSFDDGNDAMVYNFSIRPHVHQISLGVRYQY